MAASGKEAEGQQGGGHHWPGGEAGQKGGQEGGQETGQDGGQESGQESGPADSGGVPQLALAPGTETRWPVGQRTARLIAAPDHTVTAPPLLQSPSDESQFPRMLPSNKHSTWKERATTG